MLQRCFYLQPPMKQIAGTQAILGVLTPMLNFLNGFYIRKHSQLFSDTPVGEGRWKPLSIAFNSSFCATSISLIIHITYNGLRSC